LIKAKKFNLSFKYFNFILVQNNLVIMIDKASKIGYDFPFNAMIINFLPYNSATQE